jgi:UDP-glucuronate 4-epimerase
MRVLLTGAAGFIGFHVAKALLERGDEVVGVDNINDYYEISLKQARLNHLTPHKNFSFHKIDVADKEKVLPLVNLNPTHIIHLAGEAGVRHSFLNPYSYIKSNVLGHITMLELARQIPQLKHFVYASSSSVYGGNEKVPFAVGDNIDHPVSLYAATKCADELMTWTWSHIYGLPSTGLRFFTVYGPWGRPDMATFIFTKNILEGKPIKVFNHGKMRRDFTYIDDIVSGVLVALDRPPVAKDKQPPYAIYNLGNSRAEPLLDFIAVVEKAIGRKAEMDLQPMQDGDVPETYADIAISTRDLGYKPKTSIETGIPKFVEWYRGYYKI